MPNAQTAIYVVADYKIQRTMGPLDLINHLLNFVAPALFVGTVLACLAPVFMGNKPAARTLYAQAAINVIAGVVALSLGLWLFGRDGKMASYAAMLLGCALRQGLLRK
jgi:hypothetical protein